MFFQFSPNQPVKPKHVGKKEESVMLRLAPFSSLPKVTFDAVNIGDEVSKRIVIENPNGYKNKLTLSNLPSPSRNLTFSWIETEIEPLSSTTLDLTWRPDELGTWRDVLHITDIRKIRRDIPIVFQSVRKVNKLKSIGSRIKVVASKVSPLRKRLSPNYSKKKSPTKKLSPPKQFSESDKENVPFSVNTTYKNKLEMLNISSTFKSPTNITFKFDAISDTPLRRETYAISRPPTDASFDDSLNETKRQEHIDFTQKLQSNSFNFTPVIKIGNEENVNVSVSGKVSRRKELFKTNNTYNLSPDTQNISGATYTIDNISSTSAVMSPGFQDGINKQNASSPLSPKQTQTNYEIYFGGKNVRNALSCIEEEGKVDTNKLFPINKRKPELVFEVTPPKKPKVINTITKKILNTSLGFKKPAQKSKSKPATVTSSSFLTTTITTSVYSVESDPFLGSVLYVKENELDKQIMELKKWLNALFTPPSELHAITNSKKIDLAKLWHDCIKQDLIYAPSKEKVSSLYHTTTKLNSLRKVARNLFWSTEMQAVLNKVVYLIEKQQLTIRDDKNPHLDIGLQSHVMTLFLSYNPLWLRIGLETIYSETIPLESNSDITGLSTFLMVRFFRDPHLMPKNKKFHTHNIYLPRYAAPMKRFMLKKFLMLIYFLDQAKTRKIIAHDPCLFCKNAEFKESKEILVTFARELLSAMGDVTKFLSRFGYKVAYKQTYLNEYDYAVKDLGMDLRDGVRLTRAMEIILMEKNLTNHLRVPAISLLQKTHNVSVALQSLTRAGYDIIGNITEKDIVHGHREKTLSLLWQIINKFQAPLFKSSAIKIQLWWRSVKIVKKRNVLRNIYLKRLNAAIKIQRWYRSFKKIELPEQEQFLKQKKAAITIQKYFRSWLLVKRVRSEYLLKKRIVLKLQQNYRSLKLAKQLRADYLQLRNATIKIQQYFRARLIMIKTRNYYLELRTSTVVLQTYYRAKLKMKLERENYLKLRESTEKIQRYFRAMQAMKIERNYYLKLRKSVNLIQERYRAKVHMRLERTKYSRIKQSAIKIQRFFRSWLLMKEQRRNYLSTKNVAVVIQKHFRAYLLMKAERKKYLRLKQIVTNLQQRCRANKIRRDYLQLRNATLNIQQRYRANVAMKEIRINYLSERTAALVVQRQFRANLLMKKERSDYLQLKESAVKIQNRFRANKKMLELRNNYLQLKQATLIVQIRFRALISMKRTRENYLQMKRSVVIIQQRFRAQILMKNERQNYLELKQVTLIIQHRFRAWKMKKTIRNNYLELKQATLIIQRHFRALIMMKRTRENYLQMKRSAVTIQQRFRAQILMKRERQNYLELRQATLVIQCRFRALKTMETIRNNYLELKQATLVIQRHFRALIMMKRTKENYLQMKRSVIIIQQRLRAQILMKNEQKNYLELRQSTVIIQRRFRALKTMKTIRNSYLQLKQATLVIQRHYRALTLMRKARSDYLQLKNAATVLQQRFRANVTMQRSRNEYHSKKNSCIIIQQRFRAFLAMKTERKCYLELRNATIIIQHRFRANLMMRKTRNVYLQQKCAAVVIQKHFRALKLMGTVRGKYLRNKAAAITIQKWFRNCLLTKKQRQCYLLQRESVIVMQQYWRNYSVMKTERENYNRKKQACIKMQRYYRNYLRLKEQRIQFLTLRMAVIKIQIRFRGLLRMKTERKCYLVKKNACVIIQRDFRAFRARKQERNERAAVKLQSWFRMILAKKFVKNLREKLIEMERIKVEEKRNAAASRIQAAWRGYKVRSLENAKMTLIRERTILANSQAASENTIRKRTLEAIESLRYTTSFKEIIRCLTYLDFITRLLPEVCSEFCDFILTFVYGLLASTNRSLPNVESCILSTNILINLYKYKGSSPIVFQVNYLDTILSMTVHNSDKDTTLFLSLCTFLWLVAQNPEYCQEIENEKNGLKRLLKAHSLCERKQKMVSKMRNRTDSSNMKKCVLPSLSSDWGIVNENRPRTFQEPLFAITCLLNQFEI